MDDQLFDDADPDLLCDGCGRAMYRPGPLAERPDLCASCAAVAAQDAWALECDRQAEVEAARILAGRDPLALDWREAGYSGAQSAAMALAGPYQEAMGPGVWTRVIGLLTERLLEDVAGIEHAKAAERYALVGDPIHESDAECTLDEDDCCEVCGVMHGDPCEECGGRGYHAAGCSEIGA